MVHGGEIKTVGPIFCDPYTLGRLDCKEVSKCKPTVRISAINHAGEDVTRHVIPLYVYFGTTERHLNPQFICRVYDFEKKDYRDFACNGIYKWETIK